MHNKTLVNTSSNWNTSQEILSASNIHGDSEGQAGGRGDGTYGVAILSPAHTSPFELKAEVRVAQYPAEAAVRRWYSYGCSVQCESMVHVSSYQVNLETATAQIIWNELEPTSNVSRALLNRDVLAKSVLAKSTKNAWG